MVIKLVVNQSKEDVINYHVGEQTVRLECTRCPAKVIMKISEIDSDDPCCPKCKKKRR